MSLAGRKWEAKAKSFLEDYVKKNTPSGVFVLSCCGSVKSVTLRYASDPDGTTNTIETLYKYFEVLSMTGTLSQEGTHLHITLADNTGRTVGGHLVGNLMVQTTMEVALGEPQGLVLGREFDKHTGYSELVVKENG
ncbi:bifunctional protein GlmU-like isoform X2 [Oratosquilla oratoria]|uniref:bifunctional protein GlmU-like isoform X2 n=1 Tax=Oratosquilla oratoria TaxID=337810 RepID=UPI003F76E7F2